MRVNQKAQNYCSSHARPPEPPTSTFDQPDGGISGPSQPRRFLAIPGLSPWSMIAAGWAGVEVAACKQSRCRAVCSKQERESGPRVARQSTNAGDAIAAMLGPFAGVVEVFLLIAACR